MRQPPEAVKEQIVEAYRAMAGSGYRPSAPSDGFGHITAPLEELNLEAEADAYAVQWWKEEDGLTFWIGCASFPNRRAMIYCVEAARLLCAGSGAQRYAERLVKLAARELHALKASKKKEHGS